MENHSPSTSHDEDDSLSQVTIDRLGKLDHELDKIQQWMGQEHSNSESISFIEGLRRMIQSDENDVEILCDIAHIVDSNVTPMKICAKALGSSTPTTQFDNSLPMPTSFPNVPTYTSSTMTTSTQNFNMLVMGVILSINIPTHLLPLAFHLCYNHLLYLPTIMFRLPILKLHVSTLALHLDHVTKISNSNSSTEDNINNVAQSV